MPARSSIRFILCVQLAVLAACGGRTPVAPKPAPTVAPVADRSLPPNSEPHTRLVVAGDTLYSIAWEAGIDYKDVAAWNRIAPPYRLQPGQKLRLQAPPKTAQNPASSTPPVQPPRARPQEKPAKPAPSPPTKPAPPKTPPVAKAPDPPAVKPPPADTGALAWVWPTPGKVISYFTASAASNGIDIAGTRGQTVHAAAPGRVVYIGSGLRGYGQLIILKHNDEYLSAYAHNDKVTVKEGDVVKRGQPIAQMGSSGADRVKLHFEIRRRGVPVNPLQYLPKT